MIARDLEAEQPGPENQRHAVGIDDVGALVEAGDVTLSSGDMERVQIVIADQQGPSAGPVPAEPVEHRVREEKSTSLPKSRVLMRKAVPLMPWRARRR